MIQEMKENENGNSIKKVYDFVFENISEGEER